MALHLQLEVNGIFYIGDLKLRLTECTNVGRTTVNAVLDIYYPVKTKSVRLVLGQKIQVIDSVFIEIWPKGSYKRNLLTVAVDAPKDIFVYREGFGD